MEEEGELDHVSSWRHRDGVCLAVPAREISPDSCLGVCDIDNRVEIRDYSVTLTKIR